MNNIATEIRRVLRRGWIALRMHSPRGASRLRKMEVALRLVRELPATIHRLEERLTLLESDHALLAAHVAGVGARGAALASAQSDDPAAAKKKSSAPADDQQLVKVRLSAIAFYEERISALERALEREGRSRHARDADLSGTAS